MDMNCKNMDINCTIIDRLACQVAQKGLLPMPYVGPGGGRFNNPPAPHIEISILTTGCIEKFRVGSLSNRLPRRHVAVHNVHFGNRSRHFPNVNTTCLFFDVGRDPAFSGLGQRPESLVFSVRDPAYLVGLLTRVSERCLALFPRGGTYPTGSYAFDPHRDGLGFDVKHILLQAVLLEFFGALMREAQAPEAAPDKAGSIPVAQAEEFMRHNYSHPALNLADIAHSAHLSSAHFGRLFRQETGQTPLQRLRAIRIEHACRLMLQAGLRIREIARHVGFEDPLHFSRIFHTERGVSPRAYRLAAGRPPKPS
jgi:AraC-like DNA-binding protein